MTPKQIRSALARIYPDHLYFEVLPEQKKVIAHLCGMENLILKSMEAIKVLGVTVDDLSDDIDIDHGYYPDDAQLEVVLTFANVSIKV